MSMIIVDGPHHTGKSTLVAQACPELPQPVNNQPERLNDWLLEQIASFAGSGPGIAVFDHFPYFGYQVKKAIGAEYPEHRDARFEEEYFISEGALDIARDALRTGNVLLIRSTLPMDQLSEYGRLEDAKFEILFSQFDHLVYDYTDGAKVAEVVDAIQKFVGGKHGSAGEPAGEVPAPVSRRRPRKVSPEPRPDASSESAGGGE